MHFADTSDVAGTPDIPDNADAAAGGRYEGWHRLGRRLPRWVVLVAGAVAVTTAAAVLLIIRSAGACAAVAAGPALAAEVRSGKATFYGADGGGNCSFERLGGGMYVALGPSEYAAGAACGTYYDVTGPKGTVRVKVTDKCPECQPGHLDLSAEAFGRIGAPGDGIVAVTYRQVTDPKLANPLTVRVKEGSSRYWFAVRIDNHGNPLTSVEVNGGSGWVTLSRADYNYWIKADGAGPGPYTLRVTDSVGRQAMIGSVAMQPETVQQTGVWMYGAGVTTRSASQSPAPSPSAVTPSPSGLATPVDTGTPDRVTPSVALLGRQSQPARGRCR